MPYHIKLKNRLVGYACNSAKAGDSVSVISKGFFSSEDGMKLIQHLEEFSRVIDIRTDYSRVGQLLLHFDCEGNGTVYVNELSELILIHPRRKNFQRGDIVYDDDIIDIQKLEFEHNNTRINVPKDHGVFVIFSKGWRKGCYFDFEPMLPSKKLRNYELSEVLGQYYSYLMFQEIYKITEETWQKLFEIQWFPFIGLEMETIKLLINYPEDAATEEKIILDAVIADVKTSLSSFLSDWEKSKIFSRHHEFLKVAVERFEAKDWISVNSILYPRIEGILRDIANMANVAIPHKRSQQFLSELPSKTADVPPISRLLPRKFQKYLQDIYFQNFDPNNYNVARLSRNSIGHGVAPSDQFSEKAAVLGFLILQQIYYHTPHNLLSYATS